MQLFILSPNYRRNAEMLFELDFKRANKQITECLQLIAHVSKDFGYKVPLTKKDTLYGVKGGHNNHKITKWIRTDREILENLIIYTIELAKEYSSIRKREHASYISLRNWIKGNNIKIISKPFSTIVWRTWFKPGFEHLETGNVFKDYRSYIIAQH